MDEELRPPWQVCAVCGYPLEHVRDADPDEPEWIHVRRDMHDHLIIPVDNGEVRFNQRCDFCDTSDPTLIILSHDFQMDDQQRSISHWAACRDCGELARRRRWSALVTRVRSVGGRVTAQMPRAPILALYARLDVAMYGAISLEEWQERNNYRLGEPERS